MKVECQGTYFFTIGLMNEPSRARGEVMTKCSHENDLS